MADNKLELYKKRLAALKKIENPNDFTLNQIRHAQAMIKSIPIEQAKKRRLEIKRLGEDFNPSIQERIKRTEAYLNTWRKGQFKKDGKYRGEIENPLKGLKSRYSSAEQKLQDMISPTTTEEGSPVFKNDGSQFVEGPVFAWKDPKLDAEYREGLKQLKINQEPSSSTGGSNTNQLKVVKESPKTEGGYNRFTKKGLNAGYKEFKSLTGKNPSSIQKQLMKGGWSPTELFQKMKASGSI